MDTVVIVGIRQTSAVTFDPMPIVWAMSFGYLMVSGAVLAIALLGRWANSALVGLIYVLVGGFLVFLSPMIWLGAVGLNGAPPFLPEPIATFVNNVYFYESQGPLNAVALIGAGMLLVGVASIAYAPRHRAPTAHEGVEAPLQVEVGPN